MQQGTKSSRETVLFIVVLEEEVADSAADRTASKLFIH